MLDCRLNWRRAGRLERAKECRGIKREQKGHRRRSLSFLLSPVSFSLRPLSLPLARSSPLSSFVLARTERTRPAYSCSSSLSCSLVRLSLPFALLPSLSSLDKSPRLFVTHRISSSRPLTRHCRAFEHYSFALTLGRRGGPIARVEERER